MKLTKILLQRLSRPAAACIKTIYIGTPCEAGDGALSTIHNMHTGPNIIIHSQASTTTIGSSRVADIRGATCSTWVLSLKEDKSGAVEATSISIAMVSGGITKMEDQMGLLLVANLSVLIQPTPTIQAVGIGSAGTYRNQLEDGDVEDGPASMAIPYGEKLSCISIKHRLGMVHPGEVLHRMVFSSTGCPSRT